MATLYRADGTQQEIQPTNGTHFDLKELQALVGGWIEIVETTDGRLIVLDEEGKLKDKRFNLLATTLYKYGFHDPVVGDAVVGSRLEFNGPDDEDEIAETL